MAFILPWEVADRLPLMRAREKIEEAFRREAIDSDLQNRGVITPDFLTRNLSFGQPVSPLAPRAPTPPTPSPTPAPTFGSQPFQRPSLPPSPPAPLPGPVPITEAQLIQQNPEIAAGHLQRLAGVSPFLPAVEPLVPPAAREHLGRVPFIGGTLERAAEFTSPLAIGAEAAFAPLTIPAFGLAGAAGAAGLGIFGAAAAGEGAEALGAPPSVQFGAEFAGGLVGGGLGAVGTRPAIRTTRAALAGGGELGAVGGGKLKPGMRVRAADKGNIGTVLSFDEERQVARVSFFNRKTGLQQTVELPASSLTPTGGGAPRRAARPSERAGASVDASAETRPFLASTDEAPAAESLGAIASAEGKPPPPRSPVSQASGALEPENTEGTLAALLDRPPDEDFARSLWRKYAGGRQDEALEMDQAYRAAKNLQKKLKIPTSGKRTPESEAFTFALHNEGGQVPEGWQELFDLLKARQGRHESRLLAADPGFARSLVPDYWPRQFRPKNQQGFFDRLPGRKKPGQKPGFKFSRKYDSLREALDNGEEVVTWNPVDQWFRREIEGVEYIYTNLVAEAYKREARALPKSAAPPDWRTPPYRAFESRPFVGKDGKIGWSEPLVVSPDDNKILLRQFGEPFRQADIADILATVAGVSKRLKVFGGLFQHIDLSMRTLSRALPRIATGHPSEGAELMAAIPRAWWQFVSPAARARGRTARAANPVLKMLRQEGLQESGGLDIMKREVGAAIGTAEREWRFAPIENIPVVRRANDAFEFVNGGLYDSLHPTLVDSMGETIYFQIRNAHPELTARQAAAQASRTTNIIMSAIPEWQSVLAPRLRQFARGVFFSPNEAEGWFRQVSGAIAGPNARIFREQWMGYAMTTLAFAEIINLAFTGHLLDPSQLSPVEMSDEGGLGGSGAGPNVRFNTKFLRPQLTGDGPAGKLGIWATEDGRHKFLDLLGQADTPLRFLLAPGFAITSRFSAPVNIFRGLSSGRHPFYNTPVETAAERALFAAREFGAPIPATGFFEERTRIGTAGAALQASGLNVSAERLRDLRNRTAEADPEFGRPYDELTRQRRFDYRAKHPDHFATSEDLPEGTPVQQTVALSEERRERMTALGQQLQSGQITHADWRRGRSDTLLELAARRSEIPTDRFKPKTDEDKALDAFFRALDDARSRTETGILTFEEIDEVEARVKAELGPTVAAALDRARLASADPVERQYLGHREEIEDSGYWEIADREWQAFARTRPELARWANGTLRQARSAAMQALVEQGRAPEEIDAIPIFKAFNEIASDERRALREQNPRIDGLLGIWYGTVPITQAAADVIFQETGLTRRIQEERGVRPGRGTRQGRLTR